MMMMMMMMSEPVVHISIMVRDVHQIRQCVHLLNAELYDDDTIDDDVGWSV